ncbi:hypothetical protein GYMLUDRAFT_970683 [Collybiopsis luxurians FD-317 M1]|uniref:Protein kinase domain-containing protein n=1 Tax=Collybiopsis luxurians FD-317 M1 TaxID=944289 RepID=A0A0D0CBI5_9AGAR|nr:hypothetical protein GYMLUDRAFT_970683 [Collybiopsis luxurians FD-317 M1]
MRSSFPALVFELSELGTLADLQRNSESLSFEVKKKLCWDVAKGISILHACGVIHGDLKHEKILIYPNPISEAPVKYVARISDFGGSVMGLGTDGRSASLPAPAKLWSAPEIDGTPVMTEANLKLTDVYALGLLVWRTFLDGRNPYSQLHELNGEEPYTESQIHNFKCSNTLLELAKESMLYLEPVLDSDRTELLHSVFEKSLQFTPSLRDLTFIIATLQVNQVSEVQGVLQQARERSPCDRYCTQPDRCYHTILCPQSFGNTS